MSAATSTRHGSGLRPAAGLRRLGHGPLLVLRHDLRPGTPSSRRQSVGDRSPRSRTRRCWWRSKPTWRHRRWEGEGFRKVWARLRVCQRHPGCPQAGAPPDARRTICSRPIAAAAVAAIRHDGEIITHAPNLMWGTDGVRVFTVDDPAGSWRFTAVDHWNAECVGWHVCKRGDRFAGSPAADLHGACRAVWLDRGRRGSGAGWLRMDHGSQYLSGPLHQPDQVLGHPAVLRLRRRDPDQRRRRAVQSHAEGTDHPWSHLERNIAELRDAVRDFVELYNARWIVEKNGYLSPAHSGVARPDDLQSGPLDVRQTHVQRNRGATCGFYCRFTLSFRDVGDLLAGRGLGVSYETVRRWVLKFGHRCLRRLRRFRPGVDDRWHLDEMFVKIRGKQMYLRRAVDAEGEVPDFLIQSKRNKAAALKLIAKVAQEPRLRANSDRHRQAWVLWSGLAGIRPVSKA